MRALYETRDGNVIRPAAFRPRDPDPCPAEQVARDIEALFGRPRVSVLDVALTVSAVALFALVLVAVRS